MKRIIALLLAVVFTAALLTSCGETVALDQTELTMTVGDTAQLSAGKASKVSWESSDSGVATVIGGLVSAKAAGTATITASLENGEQAACTVTVTDKLINVITLDVKSTRVEVGKTIQLTASFAPADATDKRITWESGDDTIASVDENGYVTGVAEGVTNIICKSQNGVEASCTVTVGAAQLPTAAATLPPATEKPAETAAPTEGATQSGSPATTAPAPSGSFIFPDSSARYLTDSEIAATLGAMSGSPVSDSFAQDAINEIYARNGYVFRTPSISAYYQSQSWYHPDTNYDGSLNAYEQANIGMLSRY